MVLLNNCMEKKSLLGLWGSWAQVALCQLHFWRSCCSYFIGNEGEKRADNGYSAHDLYINGYE